MQDAKFSPGTAVNRDTGLLLDEDRGVNEKVEERSRSNETGGGVELLIRISSKKKLSRRQMHCKRGHLRVPQTQFLHFSVREDQEADSHRSLEKYHTEPAERSRVSAAVSRRRRLRPTMSPPGVLT